MMKVNKQIVVVLFLSMFLISFTSAFEFDNVKQYDNIAREVTIKNAFGLGGEIGKARLNTPLNVRVGLGYQKVAEFDLWAYEDYNNVLKQFTFTDMKSNKKIDRTYDLKYLTYEEVEVNDYKSYCYNTPSKNGTIYQKCEEKLIGSHLETREVWNKITPADLKKNDKLTVGVFTDVKEGDYVDWIPTIYGVAVNEWATWTADLNVDIETYYKLDEQDTTGTGTILDSLNNHNGTNAGADNTTGLINTAYNFDGSEKITLPTTTWGYASSQELSVNLWFKTTATGSIDIIMNFGGAFGSAYPSFELKQIANNKLSTVVNDRHSTSGTQQSILESTSTYNDGDWHMFTLVADGTNNNHTMYIDGSYETSGSFTFDLFESTNANYLGWETGAGYWIGDIDEVGIWTRALTSTEVENLYNTGNGISYLNLSNVAPNITLNSPTVDANYTTQQTITFNFTASDDINLTDVKLYVNDVLNQTNASGINNTDYLFNLTLSDGTYNIYGVATDNESVTATSANVTFVIDSTTPTINITYPLTYFPFLYNDQTIDLNYTISDTHLDSCWYEYNETNTTLNCSDNTTFQYISGVDNITVYANDTFGNEGNFTRVWEVKIIELNVTMKDVAVETETESYTVQLTAEGVTSISGTFSYNGTSYSATSSSDDNYINMTSTIDTPILDTDENITYYFNVTLVIDSITYNFATSNQTQLIENIDFDICNVNRTIPYINFTTYSATAPYPIINSTFKSAFTFYSINGSGAVYNTISYQDLNENMSEYSFCTNGTDYSLLLSGQLTADASLYSPTDYYFDDSILTNNTNNVSLYLLNDSLATATELRVRDDNQQDIPDVLIYIQQYDVGTDSYFTVANSKTSSIGSALVYLNWYDTFYKYLLLRDGTLVQTTLPEKAFETPRYFLLDDEITFDYEKFEGFQYDLYYNNATHNFVATYVKPSLDVVAGCLRVVRKDNVNDTEICDICDASVSSTLYCNIGDDPVNGTYVATFYATGSIRGLESITEIIGQTIAERLQSIIGNSDGNFYSFLLGILIVSLMFFSPVLAVIGIVISLLISSMMGFAILSYGILIGIVVVGGIIISFIKK